jgi:hypothetical protein
MEKKFNPQTVVSLVCDTKATFAIQKKGKVSPISK